MAILAILCALVAATPPSQPFSTEPLAGAARYALLVGCTRYPQLPAGHQLAGPGNDVLLLRDLLSEKFDFPTTNIVTLCEETGREQDRPTRMHIEREFKRLAAVAGPGDQVVIFLAGHGSQQPDNNSSDFADFEPDGLDEIFCPADTMEATDDNPDRVLNAITDDEIRVWLERILDRGAAVWLIVDACHSGTMGRSFEKARQIPAAQLVKEDKLDRARRQAARVAERLRGGSLAEHTLERPRSKSGSLVALYASQADEVTVERRFPPGNSEGKSYGLLTYTLNQVLRQSITPLTYRELVARIHGRYVQMGRTFPTPMLEGDARDREVLGLGKQPGRSSIVLSPQADGKYKINAGSLYDVTSGTILAVFPPVGQSKDDEPAGHVRVTCADLLVACVEPCGYGTLPAPAMLPAGGRCEVVYVDYGQRKLMVALDQRTEAGEAVTSDDRQRLQDELQRLAKKPQSLFDDGEDPGQADWLVRVQPTELRPYNVVLVPAAGWRNAGAADSPEFGPVPLDGRIGTWLEERLARVARATNLLRLAEAARVEHDRGVLGIDVDVQLLQFNDESDLAGKVVSWESDGMALNVGDIIALRVHNKGRARVDASFLFVDSSFGIDLYFPETGLIGDNRLSAGATLTTPKARVTSATLGLEHMIAIIIKAKPEQSPVDFSFLTQPPLERARGGPSRFAAPGSPLEQLLENAVHGAGTRRGGDKQSVADYEFRVFSWRTKEH